MEPSDLQMFKAQAQAELNRLEAQSTAKEVAGKAIGKWGLVCITVIIVIGVIASMRLEESKIAAVMGLLGSALTALISMLNGIAGANPKQEKPEFEVIKSLIERLDRRDDPMKVVVEDKVIMVTKGENSVTAGR